ncbi:MAG: hypothetical protein P4L40_07555 [Terracidiphilus sp.]|nr:hypothetical protein [Terracidiphilus sp.]
MRKLKTAVAARKATLAGLSASKRAVAQGHRTLREEHAQLCARHEGDVAAMEKGLRAVEAGLMPSLYTAIAQAEAEAKEGGLASVCVCGFATRMSHRYCEANGRCSFLFDRAMM